MRIVLIGASGNVGSAVLRAVSTSSEVDEVVAVARRVPTAELSPDVDVRWVSCDLATPAAGPALVEAMAGADSVVHLAWMLMPSRDREAMRRTNVDGTGTVIAAAQAAGVPHLVHASSVGAYAPGPKDREVDEDWPTTGIPTSRYSEDKVAAERLLDTVPDGSLAVARIRPALVVQRGAASELMRYFLPAYARPLLRVPLPVVPLPDRAITQVVHADDVADAILRIVAARATGPFNLPSGPPLHPADLARGLGGTRVPMPEALLREATALSWRLGLQPVDSGWVDLLLHSPLMSPGRAERELGWHPARTAAEALADVVSGFRSAAGSPGPLLRPLDVFR